MKHHTLLHLESRAKTNLNQTASQSANEQNSNSVKLTTNSSHNSIAAVATQPNLNNQNAEIAKSQNLQAINSQNLQASVPTQVLLATAIIDIEASDGSKKQARVVLDGGAVNHFMTNSFAQKLGLEMDCINVPISGINKSETQIKRSITAKITSKYEEYEKNVEFLLLADICDAVPLNFLPQNHIEIPSFIQLADPSFNIPSKIDALIGAELFYDLLLAGQIKINNYGAKIQATRLGWIIAGKVLYQKNQNKSKT